jgi:dihydroorotate dehydrogenase (fumarate)
MLQTNYLGITLESPVIVGSCGLTSKLENIKEYADSGAGAIVLKSLFEEQINAEILKMNFPDQHAEAFDYINNYVKNASVDEYLHMIREAKKITDTPIIASINCLSDNEWISFAKQIEEAGADALELNLYFAPIDIHKPSEEYEMTYVEIAKKIRSTIKIPFAIKLGSGITNLPALAYKLQNEKTNGLVLFNKFYEPDIDIDSLRYTSGEVFSEKTEYNRTLRWIGIIAGLVKNIDMAASTGVHTGEVAIKQILAGASAVQIVSAVYNKGAKAITEINKDIKSWMEKKSFTSIDDFKGKLNYNQSADTIIYERSQFIKYYANKS